MKRIVYCTNLDNVSTKVDPTVLFSYLSNFQTILFMSVEEKRERGQRKVDVVLL
jgi:hypothetical protein